MIDWLGMIFSGLSLALQYKQERREEEKNAKLVEILRVSACRLKLCKDVHACFQQYQLESFENFIDSFDSNPFNLKKAWETNYETYNRLYKDHNLDVFIAGGPGQSQGSTDYTILKAIDAIGSGYDVRIIEKTYPDMFDQVSSVNNLSAEYQIKFDNSILDMTMHTKINSNLKETLHSADRSMKALINILHNITAQ